MKTSEELLEKQHVTRVYDEIALHFSETRHTPWPNVAHYLTRLNIGSIVYDVGCGNGKYMNVNPNLCMIGADVSFQLARICNRKAMSTILSDVKCLPFRSDSADNVISIAVLHHLASESGRMKALQEIIRVLRPHGTALISVWAFEQRNSGSESKYLKSKNKYRKAKESADEEEEGRRRVGPDAGNRRSEPLVPQIMPKDQSPTAGGSDSYTCSGEVTSSHLMPDSVEEAEGSEGKESNNKHSSCKSSYKHKSSVESSATRTVNRDERHEIQYSCQQATVSPDSHQPNLLPEELLPSLRLEEKETSITREAEMCTGTTSEATAGAGKAVAAASQEGAEAASVTCLVEGLLLPIHRNRTAFKSQDVLVPWTRKETGERLLRYYHVFVEHELRDLCVRIPGIRILTDYYDEGNWHVVIQKEAK